MIFKLLLLSFLISKSAALPLNRTSILHDLMKFLFTDYDRNVQPTKNVSAPVPIKVTTFFYNLLNVDEQKNVVSMSGQLEFLWHDQFLVWDNTQFSQITEIYVPASKIWLPEMSLFENSNGPSASEPFGKIELKSDGHVEYRTPFLYEILCGINPRYFPWDRQTCVFRYGPANGYTNEFEIVGSKGPILESFVNHDEWEIVEASSEAKRLAVSQFDSVPDANDFVSYIEYTLVIDRRPDYYIYTLIIPSFVLTLGAIISIFTPFNAKGQRRSKAKDGISAFLVLLMLQVTVANKLPQTALVWPLCNIYFFGLIIMISVGMCVGTVIIWLEQRPIRKLSPWAKTFFLEKVAHIMPFTLQLKANEHKVDISTILQHFVTHKVTEKAQNGPVADQKSESDNEQSSKSDPARQIADTVVGLVDNWPMVIEHVTKVMKKEKEKAEWFNFLLVVERLCFFVFLFLLCFMLFLLFSHSWWY